MTSNQKIKKYAGWKTASIFLLVSALVPSLATSASVYNNAMNTCLKSGDSVKSGLMSGVDTTAMVQCNGGSGAGSSVKFYLNFGPQSGGTVYAGEVFGGSHMSVFFAGGYAYVTSALHSSDMNDPSTCEQCYVEMLVQKLSAREHSDAPGPLLIDDGIDIIPVSSTTDYKRQALAGYFKATRIWDNRDIQSSKLLKIAKTPSS